jgi:hypothetical protein
MTFPWWVQPLLDRKTLSTYSAAERFIYNATVIPAFVGWMIIFLGLAMLYGAGVFVPHPAVNLGLWFVGAVVFLAGGACCLALSRRITAWRYPEQSALADANASCRGRGASLPPAPTSPVKVAPRPKGMKRVLFILIDVEAYGFFLVWIAFMVWAKVQQSNPDVFGALWVGYTVVPVSFALLLFNIFWLAYRGNQRRARKQQ